MKARFSVLVAIAAAVIVTSVGAAAPEAAKQRVAITVGGGIDGSLAGGFVFAPLQAGSLKSDSGREQGAVAKERSVVRDGQSVKVVTWVTTAEGKHGTFVIRAVIDHADAGNGFSAGAGTWTLVRGTGQYKGLTGGGRLRQVETRRTWSERREGFVTLP